MDLENGSENAMTNSLLQDFDPDANGDHHAAMIISYVPDLKPLLTHSSRSLADIRENRILEDGQGKDRYLKDTTDSPFQRLIRRGTKILDIPRYMREGGTGGSIFNMCSSTLGAGALSLPSAIYFSGYGVGVLLILIAAVATIFSIELLIDARELSGLNSLEEIAVACFGKKMGYFAEFNVLMLCFGIAVAYCVAIGDLLTPLLELMQIDVNRDVAMVGFYCFIIAPLCIVEKVNSLRFTSFLGVLAIFFLGGVAAYSSVVFLATEGWNDSWGHARAFPSDWFGLLHSIPVIMFAFTCQINVIPIYNELENATTRKMGKITNLSIILCVVVYCVIGLFGYLNFASTTVAGNFLTNYHVEETHNVLHMSAYIAILATVALAYPLSVFPLRYTLDTVIFRRYSKDTRWGIIRQKVLAILCSALSLLVAIKAPSISFVYSLVGGTSSCFCNFVLPSIIAIKLDLAGSGIRKACVYALAVGACIIGFMSSYFTIYDEFYGSTTG